MKTTRDISPDENALAKLKQQAAALANETAKLVVGQNDVIKLITVSLFSGGHCLLVGVPGLAKTLMVKAMAAAMDLRFRRIQFTPDLMPADITGSEILDTEGTRKQFRFIQGPLFAHVVLADEINRTPPKTQAALLEAMQERQITVAQETHQLPEPFLVIATQNPIEQEGTYDLPEAQLDRFLFQIRVQYPSMKDEEKILTRATAGKPEKIKPVLSASSIIHARKLVASVHVSEEVIHFIAKLTRSTRPDNSDAPDYIKEYVEWGAGPRAGHALLMASRAWAALDGRPAVSPEDARAIASSTFRHRIGLNFTARADNVTTDELINRLLKDSLR